MVDPTPETVSTMSVDRWSIERAAGAWRILGRGFATELESALLDALASRDAELARLRAENAVPGEWTCDECGYGLSTRTLNAHTGSVGVRPMVETERCPNDGTVLRSLTWREAATVRAEALGELRAALAERDADAERCGHCGRTATDPGYCDWIECIGHTRLAAVRSPEEDRTDG